MPVVRYVRLYTDDDGQSRFDDVQFALAPQQFDLQLRRLMCQTLLRPPSS